MNISSNVSSIQTQQSYMNDNARNIANIANDMSAKDQKSLSKEITDQMSIEKSVEANVSAIKTQDEMFGSLLDITV